VRSVSSWFAAIVSPVRCAGHPLRVDAWGQYQGWLEILAAVSSADPELVPEVSLRRSTRAAVEALRREEIDLALGLLYGLSLGSGLDSTALRLEGCGLLVSSEHRLAERDTVSCSELAGERIWLAKSTPSDVDYAYRSFIARFGAVPVEAGANLGLLHALRELRQHPALAIVMPLATPLPDGAQARNIPLIEPVPCVQWRAIWRTGDRNPRLVALLRRLTAIAAKEGWLTFDSEHQWLLGTA